MRKSFVSPKAQASDPDSDVLLEHLHQDKYPPCPLLARLHLREHPEDPLVFAMAYPEVSKTNTISPNFTASANFDPHDTPPDADAVPYPMLMSHTLRILHRLLAALVADFMPTLLTVGAASHMECTDILADRWMARE
ncbi:hypothetical protein DENSPDRAFT_885864 [Dentipellis sp. KUC8613]|nr:hypothetical protein DENSPDRAFT_885864 [Dentipellis sp. KUC8613]